MPLEYSLSPDSPLRHDGVFQRITSKSLRSAAFDPEVENEQFPSGFGDLLSIDIPEEHAPSSLMHIDEYLALLSFPGIVWFVSKYVQLEPKQTALATLAGMPWPLWNDQEQQHILLSVSMAQATFLKKVFKPTDQLIPILLSLPPVSALTPQSHGQNIWQGIARMSKQETQLIAHVAKALRVYLHCLGGYVLQCAYMEWTERKTTSE